MTPRRQPPGGTNDGDENEQSTPFKKAPRRQPSGGTNEGDENERPRLQRQHSSLDGRQKRREDENPSCLCEDPRDCRCKQMVRKFPNQKGGPAFLKYYGFRTFMKDSSISTREYFSSFQLKRSNSTLY